MRLVPTLLALAYNTLIDPNAIGGNKYDDKAFDATSSSNTYLPRLALLTSSSEACKSGEFMVNHFALQKDSQNIDLGTEVDILVLAWRPKAMDMSGDVIITSYESESESFRNIQAKADVKDSKCMFGPEFLVYVPKVQQFMTFFCGSKSSRREAAGVKGRMHKAATLKPKKCETKDYTWFVATAHDCSTPFNLPEMDAIKEQIEKFNNPPAPTIEKIAAPATGGRER